MSSPAAKLTLARLPSRMPFRGGQTEDLLAVLELDHRAAVLEDLVAARALGEAVGDFLADHLVLIRREALDVGVHQHDRLHRDLRLIEELELLAALGPIGLRHAPGVGGDVAPDLRATTTTGTRKATARRHGRPDCADRGRLRVREPEPPHHLLQGPPWRDSGEVQACAATGNPCMSQDARAIKI
jgi:hypothetical protein